MIKREAYFNRIKPFLGKPVVKVLTGMRRVGKSCLMRLLIDDLLGQGISESAIVYVDKESYRFDAVKTYHDLATLVEERRKALPEGEQLHVFVDEVQQIEGWERIVASWSGDRLLDVVVTGSNAAMLSGEIATLLAGRSVEFKIYPLGFAEFLAFHRLESTSLDAAFDLFLRHGGMPGLCELGDLSDRAVSDYLDGVYNTVLLRDVAWRHQIRNTSLLERILRYLFDNIGNVSNVNRIVTYFKSLKVAVGVESVINDLRWFEEAHLVKRLEMFDVRGRRQLDFGGKYFVADLGIRNHVLGYRAEDIGGMLENVVAVELMRRGFSVSVGRLGETEIDFIAERGVEKAYYQVSYLPMGSEATWQREITPLRKLNNSHPKFILSMDRHLGMTEDGIRCVYLPEWLLQREERSSL